MVDIRASTACTIAAARSGAYWPWRAPTGIGWRFPRGVRVMNLPFSGRQRALWLPKEAGAGKRVTSIISKGSELVQAQPGENPRRAGFGHQILCVLKCWRHAVPVIIEPLRRINGAVHRGIFGAYTSARADRKTLLTIAENGRSLPLTVTNAGRIESKSFRLRRASAIAPGRAMRVSHVRAIFELTLHSAASRHFTRVKLMGSTSGRHRIPMPSILTALVRCHST
jgi:hypothetical protein